MRSAASRIRVVHIFVRKLKLSSRSATTAGRSRESAEWKPPSSGSSMASKSDTETPSRFSTAAARSVASGGGGLLFPPPLGGYPGGEESAGGTGRGRRHPPPPPPPPAG